MATRVFRSLSDARSTSPSRSGVTLGVFDGVHAGHREIIATLTRARDRGDVDGCYLITFDPHPLQVTHSRIVPPMLTTIDERVALLDELGLDGVVVLPFDRELAEVDYRAFLRKYLVETFDMKRLVLGYDCRFGRGREGNPERASEEGRRLGFEVVVVPPWHEANEVVSSTKIRNALTEGDIERANRLLGHPYLITGTVVDGHGRGRDLGFPTANLSIGSPLKLWPPRGVYAVTVDHDGRHWRGMMNIGKAPTVKNLGEDAQEIEVHVFDFEGDLYGQSLRVGCHAYLRAERRFPSLDALVTQLHADRDEALARLAALGDPRA